MHRQYHTSDCNMQLIFKYDNFYNMSFWIYHDDHQNHRHDRYLFYNYYYFQYFIFITITTA